MADKIFSYPDYAALFKSYTGHNSKTMRNIVGVDPGKLNMLRFWGKAIEKTDNIRKIMTNLVCDHNEFVFGKDRRQNDRYSEFERGYHLIKELSQNSETIAVNRLISHFKKKNQLSSLDIIVFLADIGNMADIIKETVPDYEFHMDKDLEKFHDNLSKDSLRIK
jgi:hypothetical protein